MKTLELGAQIKSVRPLADRSMSLTFHTQELSPEEQVQTINYLSQFGVLAFIPDATEMNYETITKTESGYEDGKTPSRRQRGIIYKLWEKKKDYWPDFEVFYRSTMDGINNKLKEQLDK